MRKLLIVPLMWCASVSAQEVAGAYVGFGLGQLDYEERDFGITLEDTTLAYKVYGGYRFNEVWSFEASYGVTDDLKWSESGFIPGVGNVSLTLQGDYEILEVRGLAHLKAFLVGVGYWDADLSANLSGTAPGIGPFSISTSDSDSGASMILGGQWALDRWGIRAEYELFDTESTVDAFTLGLSVHHRF